MKRFAMFAAAALMLAALIGLVPVLSQDMGGDEGEKACGGDETAPAEPTKGSQDPNGVLKNMLGTWNMAFKLYMEPGADPIEMSFDMKNEWALDEQFIRAEYDMKEGPFPHKGIEFFSYNEATGEYQEIRITSMSGMQIVYSGKYDADKKTLELKASYSGDWQGTKYKATSREVYVWKDDDHFTCTVYTKYEDMPDIPNEVKEVEIVATRKK
ncbi:MAG: DUF1579 family protein [Planctomycetes bacterium]|nr:DUF1579 family protein [Planctomycetota bacterium]